MYKLVIAEKPSVAKALAKVIGANKKKEGYLEGNGYLVSWCIGHLVEPAEPQHYEERYAKWKYDDLPILPEKWKYVVAEKTKAQYHVLQKLMQRSDVESLIEATDAGREGELIFRLVYHYAGCKKPFKRLWISSMEDDAIRDGFAKLKDSQEYDALFKAALCRERADWIVGMNATRLFSILYGPTLNVGRVMTPTLAMVVSREKEIREFKPELFYTVLISVGGVMAVSERFSDKHKAEELVKRVGSEGILYLKKKEIQEKKEKPPLLYDLTSLQRDANRIYGFTAQQTLDYAQELYEKKLITYPRTDSRFLTDDMEESVMGLVPKIAAKFGYPKELSGCISQVINPKKVKDHHALIPTGNVVVANFAVIPSGESKILFLIAARFLAAVGKAYEFQETNLEAVVGDAVFKAKMKEETNKGFKEVQSWILGKETEEETEKEAVFLEELKEGSTYPLRDPKIKEGKTTPKKHYTEESLLAAMERAGEGKMPKEAEHKGIGTPATRAGVIEKLVRIGFIERAGDKKAKDLIPTKKGVSLIEVIPEMLKSPSMTADWEEKLIAIEAGTYEAEQFMQEIMTMIFVLKRDYKVIENAEVMKKQTEKVVGKCPCCMREVEEKEKAYFCSNRLCRFVLWKDHVFFGALGKRISPYIAGQLLEQGEVYLSNCRSEKTGKIYAVTVCMTVDEEQKVKFSLRFPKGGNEPWKKKR